LWRWCEVTVLIVPCTVTKGSRWNAVGSARGRLPALVIIGTKSLSHIVRDYQTRVGRCFYLHKIQKSLVYTEHRNSRKMFLKKQNVTVTLDTYKERFSIYPNPLTNPLLKADDVLDI
jgi:hypothetical protein